MVELYSGSGRISLNLGRSSRWVQGVNPGAYSVVYKINGLLVMRVKEIMKWVMDVLRPVACLMNFYLPIA
jgi:hypothetical protein